MKIVSAEFIKSAAEPSHYPESTFPEIAFAGRSNVGKSSLINTITSKKSLARTSSTPGCTQLINFFIVNNQLSFVDLPGYGFAKVPEAVRKNWKPMIEKYLTERKTLRLVILIVDIRRDPSEEELSFIQWLHMYNIPFLFVLTKIDKLSRNQRAVRWRRIKESLGLTATPVLFSARTGEGKKDIWKTIRSVLDQEYSPPIAPQSIT
ncbi:MAG: ribosome biogenesis GTP-binding protein YihA/YsxC [Syntrophaceae bacterium]